MATFPSLTLVKAIVHGSQGQGSALVNIFNWCLYVGEGDGPTDLQLRTAVGTHLSALWDQVKSSTPGTSKWDYYETYVKGLADLDFYLLGQDALNLTGLDVSDPLPAGLTPCVTGITSFKKRRARKFIPTFGETYSTGPMWTANAIVRLASWAAKWALGIDITPAYAVLYPIALKASTFAWSALTGVRANTIPAYQRRRKPGVGA